MDWNKIYEKNFIYANECYKTCDGYCCKNFFGTHFKFLDKDAVILPLIDDEYNEYKKRGGIKNINDIVKKEIPFDDKIFTLYLLKCREKGLCNPHNNRPFICRIYPYFPVIDLDGNVVDFVYASLIDNLVDENYHKCTLIKDNSILKELRKNLLDISFSTKMILGLKLVELLIKYLKSYIPNKIDNKNKEQNIVTKFEMLFLSNKIFKNENFQLEAKQIYSQIKEKYGNFL